MAMHNEPLSGALVWRGTWLGSTTIHRSTGRALRLHAIQRIDLLTARGVAHPVVYGTRGSTSYETIPPVRLETSGGVLSTVDTVVQRRDGPRRLRDCDDDDDEMALPSQVATAERHTERTYIPTFPTFTSHVEVSCLGVCITPGNVRVWQKSAKCLEDRRQSDMLP